LVLDWDEGGRDYDAGPELEIEVEFEAGDYTGECP
jgi:hypothetical protein